MARRRRTDQLFFLPRPKWRRETAKHDENKFMRELKSLLEKAQEKVMGCEEIWREVKRWEWFMVDLDPQNPSRTCPQTSLPLTRMNSSLPASLFKKCHEMRQDCIYMHLQHPKRHDHVLKDSISLECHCLALSFSRGRMPFIYDSHVRKS